jgi:hypothetical protein
MPPKRVESGLHEILEITGLHECARLLAQAGSAGLLPFDQAGGHGANVHRQDSGSAGDDPDPYDSAAPCRTPHPRLAAAAVLGYH